MRRELWVNRILKVAIAIIASLLAFSNSLSAAAIEGRILDRETGQALPYATIQILGTGKATSANDDGRFRIVCEPGKQILKVSHIGYYTTLDTVEVVENVAEREISLLSTVVLGQTVVVYDRQYDPAQLIIIEAIKRKKEILERIGDYKYSSYTKFVARDLSKEDSSKIMAITETQAQSFWERPNKYKEIITARRQSANMSAADNLVTIGEMLNFNKNRIDIGSYSVVSPVAEDALGYYNYYLLDSTYIDSRKVYKLEVEPKNQADALVEGYLLIADSTYDVVDVDFGFNEGVRLPFVKDLRYVQRVAQFENLYWMPIEIRFTADVVIKFPGIPDKIGIDLAGSIYDYSFETGHAENTFDEYAFEVAETADEVDSTTWSLRQSIPLSIQELRGYARLDSIQKAPKPLRKQLLEVGVVVVGLFTVGAYDFARFNRVEGPYLGLEDSFGSKRRGLQLDVKSGYAFETKLYQYKLGTRYQFPGRKRVAIKAEYLREVAQRQTLNQGNYNSTFESLFFKYDPVSYFYRRGGSAGLEFSPIQHFKLEGNVSDFKQRSLSNATDFSYFNRSDEYLVNPSIVDGNLRMLTGSIEYDSRKLWKNKGQDMRMWSPQYTTLKLTAEMSSPDFLSSDFDYRRYYVSVYRRQRTLGLGVTHINLFAGSSTRSLPPQSYYQLVDYAGVVAGENAAFMTLGDYRIAGDRAAYVYANHEFGQYLFKKSGIPLIKSIPFTLGVHGGTMWSDFHNVKPHDDGRDWLEAEKPYSEIGFSLGNLTPFLSILNFGVYLTWQLSDYNTNTFIWRLGIKF